MLLLFDQFKNPVQSNYDLFCMNIISNFYYFSTFFLTLFTHILFSLWGFVRLFIILLAIQIAVTCDRFAFGYVF